MGPVLTFPAVAGTTYLVEKSGTSQLSHTLEHVSGTPATTIKKLGPVQIGLAP